MSFGNRKETRRSNIMMLLEAIIICYVGYLASVLVKYFFGSYFVVVPLVDFASQVGLFTILVILSALSVGLYEIKLRETFRGVIRRIFVSVAISYFIIEVVTNTFLTNIEISQYYLPSYAGMTILAIVIFRYFINRLGILGLGQSKIIVIGAGERASIIEKRMRREVDRFGFELVGFIPIPGDNREEGIQNEKLLHVKIDENFRNFIADNDIDEVVIACDQRRGTLSVEILFDCRLRGVEVTDLLDFMERETGQIVVNLMYPSWVIYSNGFNSQNYLRDALDYSMNCIMATLVLLLTWPFMLLTAIIIFLEDANLKNPSVIYKQERVGLNGVLFNIIKFRSMRLDAEKDGAKWATANDARVTKVGYFIRKFRIDELPQIWNIFRGEMSFIGPRPERPQFVEQLIREIPYYNQRHNVKPGLAGWAQLNYPYGASVEDSMEKLKFDLYYVKHQSLMLDILILIRTVEVVLFGKGR
ncbi:TIGR03013 family XrtA/PEP-CTERM system glycosyltransferase [Paraglaciecola psychrophila]|uniref:Sugar transferase n=1 Tax=Paraglaciecola psychrophila 170 TaxID=1129794 RepID=K6Z5I9_9ALTE|nr:TIGR03013 family XrtA/PEP-CTERM system glycosyltransferase [Paraglaciecola psychrophila]AGH46329.1 sugar transferase [Paraglaciecola psychrophila 170]GAC40319.1 bacterial sugar transferase domain protein [Paraglaciecola psychrophila 170]